VRQRSFVERFPTISDARSINWLVYMSFCLASRR
jgi:hypothetical protein